MHCKLDVLAGLHIEVITEHRLYVPLRFLSFSGSVMVYSEQNGCLKDERMLA